MRDSASARWLFGRSFVGSGPFLSLLPLFLAPHAAIALLPSATFSAPAADQPQRGPPAGLNSAAAVAAHFPPIFGLSLGSGFWRNLDGTKKKRDQRLPEISLVFGLGKGFDLRVRNQQPRDETWR